MGTLGREAFLFVERLARAGATVWQLLPLLPGGDDGSPYNGLSGFAGNPLLVSGEALAEEGLTDPAPAPPHTPRADFAAARRLSIELVTKAYRAFRDGAVPQLRGPFADFQSRHAHWLDDYSLFVALKGEEAGRPWTEWEPRFRDRNQQALAGARRELAEAVGREKFAQLLFDRQWRSIRSYARARGVELFGDLPIFVAHDSADVWAHRDLFKLDREGRAEVVTGVPPDYFSEDGQKWGNPHYRWDSHRATGYGWWSARMRRSLELFDLVRVDHFRGFEAAWEVPAEAESAREGRWAPGPGAELFRAARQTLGTLPLVAEDLGVITPGVNRLRDALGLPGMRVLQFGFDGNPANPHLPGNHPRNSVAYTGTHDNDTALGWYRSAAQAERELFHRYCGGAPDEPHLTLAGLALGSRARLAVLPAGDLLGLGSEARMNTPGTVRGNWRWRLGPDQFGPQAVSLLGEMIHLGRRVPEG